MNDEPETNNEPGCWALPFVLLPIATYWATVIAVLIKLLETDLPVFRVLLVSVCWPLALVDEIIRAAIVMP